MASRLESLDGQPFDGREVLDVVGEESRPVLDGRGADERIGEP